MRLEGRHGKWVEGELPMAAGGLGLGHDDRLPVDDNDHLDDCKPPWRGLQVDRPPRHTEQLASAHPGGREQQPHRGQAVVTGRRQERSKLLSRPDVSRLAGDTRRVGGIGNVPDDKTPAHRIAERLVQQHVDVPDALRLEPATAVPPTMASQIDVQAVEVPGGERLERDIAQRRHDVGLGGYGKTRLAVELARSGHSATPWFFVPYGLPFEADYLAEVEAGYDVTALIDDAHRRTDLDQLLHALERRDPKPRLVCTVRPGHAAVVEMALRGLALPKPTVRSLGWLGRSALDTILNGPPFAIQREGMRSWIIAVSEGNVGVALIAGGLAAAGHDPRDLSQADLFAEHVGLRLHGAGADSGESRELLALIAGVGALDLGDVDDVAATTAILGGDLPQLRRRLDDLAELGVVEEGVRIYTIKPDIVREHLLRASFFPEAGKRRPLLRYQDVYSAFAPRRLYALLEALGQARVDTTPAAAEALAKVQRDLVALQEQATTATELENVMLAAQALGACGGAIVRELVEAVLDRLDRLDDAAADQVAVRLVEALNASWEWLHVLAGKGHGQVS